MDLELWSDDRFTSPWVLSVWAALKEKGLPFTVKTVSLERGDHRNGEYSHLSLTSKVPALRHGDFWLSESSAIIEYLDETFPARPALRGDAQHRARDRQLMSWLRSDFFALRESLNFEGLFEGRQAQPTPQAREQAERLLAAASGFLAGRRYEEPTAADFDLAFMVRRLVHYRYPLDDHPQVVAHCQSIWSRPSVQSFVLLPR